MAGFKEIMEQEIKLQSDKVRELRSTIKHVEQHWDGSTQNVMIKDLKLQIKRKQKALCTMRQALRAYHFATKDDA